jgi:hypothetical protein
MLQWYSQNSQAGRARGMRSSLLWSQIEDARWAVRRELTARKS